MVIAEKFREVIKDKKISARKFELSIGKTSGYVNMMERRNTFPSSNLIITFCEQYPEYNLYWILGLSDQKYLSKENMVNEPQESYSKELDKINFLREFLSSDVKQLDKKFDIMITQSKEMLGKIEGIENESQEISAKLETMVALSEVRQSKKEVKKNKKIS